MNTTQYLLDRFPNGGYFVEAGAHDGVGDSQTYALEQVGWKGLCVEPSKAYTGLKERRKCAVDNRPLWHRSGASVVWREVEGNAVELSGILTGFCDDWDRQTRSHRDKVMMTVGLTNLLDQHNAPPTIEFLSLDTEGSELSILTGHDFDKYRFLFAAVEHNGVEVKRKALLSLLERHGMKLIDDDGVNLFMEQR
jgi:hypothetical protein